MNERDDVTSIDLYTEPDVEKLRAEAILLRERLELRAVECSVLRLALDTIGKCANAQGRRFTVAIVAVFDDPHFEMPMTSILVSDPGADEGEIGTAIGKVLSPVLTELVDARALSPDAFDLLDVLADLDGAGVLESTYNIDAQSEHDDVACDDIPPFEAALYAWRNAGYPIYEGDANPADPLGPSGLPPGAVEILTAGRTDAEIGRDVGSAVAGMLPPPALRPIPGGKGRQK